MDSQTELIDWNKRNDIKASLKVKLILTLADHDYPPVERDEAVVVT